jgi:thioredoxin-like negative regulator of GroEL
MSKEIITSFENRKDFLNLLKNNPGLVILKLGATWCGPCKKIEKMVHDFFATSPENVICADIDVDESFDLYACLKSNKMVNGIPVMLCYKRGNVSYIPDDSVTGTEITGFLMRCGKYASTVN